MRPAPAWGARGVIASGHVSCIGTLAPARRILPAPPPNAGGPAIVDSGKRAGSVAPNERRSCLPRGSRARHGPPPARPDQKVLLVRRFLPRKGSG